MKGVLRDPTHASTRISRRPWQADETIQQVFSMLIQDKTSFANMVKWSPDFQNKFHAWVQKMERSSLHGPRMRSLSYSKHRFNSTQKPLGRFVLLFEAIIMTALEINTARAGKKEGHAAADFLEFLSAERLVLVGMLADAGDECQQLTLDVESESYDVAQLGASVQRFVTAIDALFNDKAAHQHGYTKFMLSSLQTPRTFVVKDSPKTLGGPSAVSPEALERCYKHLQGWVKLAMLSLDAEFPMWHILQAFHAFDLSGLASKTKHKPPDTEGLKRVAQTFRLNEAALIEEFYDHYNIAAAMHKRSSSSGSHDCWQQAIRRTQDKADTRARHPAGQLKIALSKYSVLMGATTSGIESNFSTLKRLCGGHSTHEGDTAAVNKVKLTVDVSKEEEEEEICKRARGIWAAHYGEPRRSGRANRPDRMDAGTTRSKEEAPLPKKSKNGGIRLRLHLHLHKHTYTPTHTHAHKHIHTHTHTHTHIHT